MGEKMKRFGAFAFISFVGFLLGIVANLVSSEVLPILIKVFPQIFEKTWVVWGLIGALLSVICCLIYAYLT